MDEKACMVCGNKIHGDDLVCNRCYADIDTWMPTRSILPGRLGVIILGFALLVLSVFAVVYNVIIGAILIAAIGLWLISIEFNAIKEDRRLFDLAKTDYMKYVEEEHARYKADAMQPSQRIPACPICHSKQHVRRLGNLDRTVSTAVWGAASSAIGKQWECTSCNHKFNVDAVAPSQEPVKVKLKPSQPDPTDELRKYKQLLDDGLITQEDYDQKKKQLLGL